jgi:transcription elongation factor Elf1
MVGGKTYRARTVVKKRKYTHTDFKTTDCGGTINTQETSEVIESDPPFITVECGVCNERSKWELYKHAATLVDHW